MRHLLPFLCSLTLVACETVPPDHPYAEDGPPTPVVQAAPHRGYFRQLWHDHQAKDPLNRTIEMGFIVLMTGLVVDTLASFRHSAKGCTTNCDSLTRKAPDCPPGSFPYFGQSPNQPYLGDTWYCRPSDRVGFALRYHW